MNTSSIKCNNAYMLVDYIRSNIIAHLFYYYCSRPHIKKNGDKTCYRIFWEWFHRIYGISVILIGLTQVSLGVFLIVPPQPVWIVWIIVVFTWVISFTLLEVVKCLCFVCRSDGNESKDEIEMKNTHP